MPVLVAVPPRCDLLFQLFWLQSGTFSLEFCALWRRNNPEVDLNFARFCGTANRKISGNRPNRSAQNSPEFCALEKPLGGTSSKGLASTHNSLYPTPGRFMAFAIFDGLNGTWSTYAIRPQRGQSRS
jgi:hypothetical protein